MRNVSQRKKVHVNGRRITGHVIDKYIAAVTPLQKTSSKVASLFSTFFFLGFVPLIVLTSFCICVLIIRDEVTQIKSHLQPLDMPTGHSCCFSHFLFCITYQLDMLLILVEAVWLET